MSKVIFIIPTLLAILIVFLIFQLSSKAIQTEALVRADFKHNITFDQLIPKAQKQVMCLAENIFYESAHEPLDGQVAVAFVTLNRVKSKSYPNNICSVVKQKNPRGCQFSWYCDGKSDNPKDTEAWDRAMNHSFRFYQRRPFKRFQHNLGTNQSLGRYD